MRLNAIVGHAQSFFETVGYLRFSAFYSPPHLSRGELVQKVARAVTGVFALLSFIDFFFRPLPSYVRFIVNGSLIALISSLGMSLLLKSIQHFLNQSSEESELEKENIETSSKVSFSKKNTPPYKVKSFGLYTPPASPRDGSSAEWQSRFSRARRDLLPEFERIAKEAEIHE